MMEPPFGRHIAVEETICVFCQSLLEVDDVIVAVLEMSATQSLTFRFRLRPREERRQFVSPYHCNSDHIFEVCSYNIRHGSGKSKCPDCSKSPGSFLYHSECWHGIEFLRAQIYPSAPPLSLKSAKDFHSSFQGRWNTVFENSRCSWGRLDLDELRKSLPGLETPIPQEFGNLPLELRQIITDSLVSSFDPTASLITKMMVLLDVARILFDRPAQSRIRFLGNTYANADDTLGEVIGLDHLGIRMPNSGSCPWYLHNKEFIKKESFGQSSKVEIVPAGGFMVPSKDVNYVLWDTPELVPIKHHKVRHSKRYRKNNPYIAPVRMRTITLKGATGLTFFVSPFSSTESAPIIRAIHRHDFEDSSALSTFKSLPDTIRRTVLWIYFPLGQIEKVWARSDYYGLELMLGIGHGDVSIGGWPDNRGITCDQLNSGAVECMVYSLPDEGRHIEVFGAVSNSMTNSVEPREPRPCRLSSEHVETIASLAGVQYVQVYEEIEGYDRNMCMGICFTYNDGSRSCVGQRRVGLNTKVTRYNNPEYLYYETQYTHPSRHSRNQFGRALNCRGRFFFSNDVHDEMNMAMDGEMMLREYLRGWEDSTESPGIEEWENWRDSLLSRRIDMVGSLHWIVAENQDAIRLYLDNEFRDLVS